MYREPRRPRILSLFSGCGGMDLGAELAGGRVIWANEKDPFACKTYRNFSGFNHTTLVEGSIENLDLDIDLPEASEVDVVLGGFPCQDFSMIWKRPGLLGSRGNLYTYFVDIVRRKKPLAFVAENVKGLLSANKGRAIQQIQDPQTRLRGWTELGDWIREREGTQAMKAFMANTGHQDPELKTELQAYQQRLLTFQPSGS